MNQLNSMIDGVVLKGDLSFKIIKHMGKTNGTSVFASLYTVNERIRRNKNASTGTCQVFEGAV